MERRAAGPRPARARVRVLLAAAVMLGLGSCAETSPLLEGTVGSSESPPFALQGGRYLLGWTAAPAPGESCAVVIEVVDDDEGRTINHFEAAIPPGGRFQAAEPVRFLAAGTYRLAVESTCPTWTAVIGEDRVGDRG